MAVVGYQDEGAAELEQLLFQPVKGAEVEVVCRLVEEQEVGALEQDASQGGSCLFAAGQELNRLREVGVRETDAVEGGADGGFDLVPAVGLVAVEQVVVAVQILFGSVAGKANLELAQFPLCRLQGGECRLHRFEQRPVALKPRGLRKVPHACRPNEADHAGRRGFVAGQEPQERRLPRAVVADQGDPVTGPDLSGERREQRVAPERFCELFHLDEGHACHGT
jgi:hypothetical protein